MVIGGESKSVVWILNLDLVLTQGMLAAREEITGCYCWVTQTSEKKEKEMKKVGSAGELKIPRHHLIVTATSSGWQVSEWWLLPSPRACHMSLEGHVVSAGN